MKEVVAILECLELYMLTNVKDMVYFPPLLIS